MYRFIESIATSQGQMPLLDWHQKRLNETFARWYPRFSPHKLFSLLSEYARQELHKIRFLYNENHFTIEVAKYDAPQTKSLKLVKSHALDYQYKYAERAHLNALHTQKGTADDVLIIIDDLPTDSYYANVCYYDGKQWWTSTSYLLNGVMRQKLLHEGVIKERVIHPQDLPSFEKLSLINALNPLGQVVISPEQIRF